MSLIFTDFLPTRYKEIKYFYVLIKFSLKNWFASTSTSAQICIHLTSIGLFPIVYASWLMFFIICMIYSLCIEQILSYWYGTKFGGLMPPMERLFSIEPSCTYNEKLRSLVPVFFFVEYDGNATDFYRTASDYFMNNFILKIDKFCCIRQRFLDMDYYLRCTPRSEEIIQVLELPVNVSGDEKIFYDYVSELANINMPNNNEGMVRMFIGKQKVKWLKGFKDGAYVIWMQLHHGTCDGYSMMKLIQKFLVQKEELQAIKGNMKIITSKSTLTSIEKHQSFEISENSFLKQYENPLGGVLNGKKHMHCYDDLEGRDYVNKIKSIKNKLCVNFNSVVLTAFFQALEYYFRKNNSNKLDNICIDVLFHGDTVINTKRSISVDGPTVDLVSVQLIIPTHISHECDILERIKEIHKIYSKSKYSLDVELSKWIRDSIMAIAPRIFIRLFLKKTCSTIVFSNLEGLKDRIRLFNGCKTHYIMAAPNAAAVGLSFTCSNYMGNLQCMSFTDNGVIQNSAERDGILTKFIESLDEMDAAINDHRVIDQNDKS